MRSQDVPLVKKTSLSYFKKNKFVAICAALLALIALLAIFVPQLAPYTISETHLEIKNSPPSLSHWFGTDELGRDLFVRSFFGVRISLFVGIAAAAIDLTIGTIYGATAAFAGKKIEEGMMRLIDILTSIPNLLLVILLMVCLGPGLITVLIALTLTGWMSMARIVRAEVSALKNLEYIKAAHALGASFWRILFRHLLPNCLSSIIVTAMLTIPAAIFSEAFLSFLGLGIQAPLASLGAMVNDGLPALRFYPFRLFVPASLITLVILLFHILGDALRDFSDPRGA